MTNLLQMSLMRIPTILSQKSNVSSGGLKFELYGPLNDQMRSSLLIILILIVVCIILGHKISKVNPEDKPPLWLVPLEIIVDTVESYCKENMGKRYKSYAPFILTIGLFLLVANTSTIWTLTPPTCYVSVNFGLALMVFFTIQGTGIVSNGIGGYLKSFVSPVFVILPINIISEVSLPITLSLRLFGNVLSGNVMEMFIEGSLTNALSSLGSGMEWIALAYGIILPVLNVIFDIFSGVIQVLVFCLLSMIFIGNKINDEDKKLDLELQ